jgi:hypothetical protein
MEMFGRWIEGERIRIGMGKGRKGTHLRRHRKRRGVLGELPQRERQVLTCGVDPVGGASDRLSRVESCEKRVAVH